MYFSFHLLYKSVRKRKQTIRFLADLYTFFHTKTIYSNFPHKKTLHGVVSGYYRITNIFLSQDLFFDLYGI